MINKSILLGLMTVLLSIDSSAMNCVAPSRELVEKIDKLHRAAGLDENIEIKDFKTGIDLSARYAACQLIEKKMGLPESQDAFAALICKKEADELKETDKLKESAVLNETFLLKNYLSEIVKNNTEFSFFAQQIFDEISK